MLKWKSIVWEEQGCKVLSTCKMVFLFILQ